VTSRPATTDHVRPGIHAGTHAARCATHLRIASVVDGVGVAPIRGEAALGSPVTTRVIGRAQEDVKVKVHPSVKKMCDKCKIIRRRGAVRVICENPRHKQRQG